MCQLHGAVAVTWSRGPKSILLIQLALARCIAFGDLCLQSFFDEGIIRKKMFVLLLLNQPGICCVASLRFDDDREEPTAS